MDKTREDQVGELFKTNVRYARGKRRVKGYYSEVFEGAGSFSHCLFFVGSGEVDSMGAQALVKDTHHSAQPAGCIAGGQRRAHVQIRAGSGGAAKVLVHHNGGCLKRLKMIGRCLGTVVHGEGGQ